MQRQPAILLLGPTGSGKTPLGDLLERRGLRGARCAHFDFGSRLRAVAAAADPPEGLTAADVALVRGLLRDHALLEDEHFPIAETMLRAFIAERRLAAADRLVLNGLPRHVAQAERVAETVDVTTVIHLACTDAVVLERIRTNAGGDRAERDDDDPSAVRKKLADFARRGAPLLDHYRARGAAVREIRVGPADTPEDLWRRLDELLAQHRVRFTHVRGHAGHPENERCDTLAVAAYQKYL